MHKECLRLQARITKMIEAVKEDGIGAALMHDSWTSGCSEVPYVSYMRFIQRDYMHTSGTQMRLATLTLLKLSWNGEGNGFKRM